MTGNAEKLTSFNFGGRERKVTFIETLQVKNGVECDVYTFEGDDTQDLAIVRVARGCKTPLQKVVLGNKTTEGFLAGKGTLTVRSGSGDVATYNFDKREKADNEVIVNVGQIMQWTAPKDVDLVFYEVCDPPYQDGRFENLTE